MVAESTNPAHAAARPAFLTAYLMMVTNAPAPRYARAGDGDRRRRPAARRSRETVGCRVVVTSRHPWKLEKAQIARLPMRACSDTPGPTVAGRRMVGNVEGVDLAADLLRQYHAPPCDIKILWGRAVRHARAPPVPTPPPISPGSSGIKRSISA